MLGRVVRQSNPVAPRFAVPPWTRSSTEWKSLDAALPDNHVARTMVAAVANLDLKPLYASYQAGGSDAIAPKLLLTIVLIEISLGRRSPVDWFRDTRECLVLQWAGFGIRPSRSVWYGFRKRLNGMLEPWFLEVLTLAKEMEITPAQRGALDGTFIAANASRHHLLNADRVKQRQDALAEACAQDEQGKEPDSVPRWMATTPAGREQQATRYEQAGSRLKELHAANQRLNPARRRPAQKVVVNATDPEAALGLDKEKVFRPVYVVQIVRDLDSKLILNYDVFAQNTDGGTLLPMLERGRERFELNLLALAGDASYVTACNLAHCAQEHVTLYGPWQANDYTKDKQKQKGRTTIPKEEFKWDPEAKQYLCLEGRPLVWIGQEKRTQTDGQVNVMHRYRCSPQHCSACPRKASCTSNPARGRAVKRSEHEDLIEAHRERMATPEAKAVYRLRKQTVELQFADFKANRKFRRFSGRSLTAARIETGLTTLAHNLLIVEKHRKQSQQRDSARDFPYQAAS